MKTIVSLIVGACLSIGVVLGWNLYQATTDHPALMPTTADAASYVQVCDHYLSDGPITAYNNTYGISKLVWPGGCTSIRDDNNTARVDLDPAGIAPDIDSWRKAHMDRWGGLGDGWGPCYAGENGASDPYSGTTSTLAASTMYLNYEVTTNCWAA